MKIFIKIFLIVALFSGCAEEVDFELDQYVKVLSLDRSSFAEKIIELDNGDLMILGEMGISAFEQESTGQGSEVNELEDQAPFISITDQNGNLKMLRMYPFEDIRLGSPFEEFDIINLNNITSFQNIVSTSDGGYIVHAQSLGYDFFDPRSGELIESQAGALLYNDYLLKLDPDFNVKKIQTYQGYAGWDGIVRIRGNLKKIKNEEMGFLLSQRNTSLLDGDIRSSGFTFFQLNDNLDTIKVSDIQSPNELIGYDFATNGDNNISILTSNESDFETWQSALNQISENVDTRVISGDAVGNSQNRDENFIEAMPDGSFILVYTQPPVGIVMEHRGSDMSLLSGPHNISNGSYANFTIRATRGIHITADNQLLIYVLNIPSNSDRNLFGELFRVGLDGLIFFSKEIEGVPGDVIETRDGSVITVSNNVYNGSLQKIHITKMNGNGKLF